MKSKILIFRRVVYDRWHKLGFANLLPEERDFITIDFLVGEVSNGTFAQYFSNDTGDNSLEALEALRRCGIIEGSQLLQEAMDLFNSCGGYTSDRDIRNERIDFLEAQPSARDEGAFRLVTDKFLASINPMQHIIDKLVMDAYNRNDIDFLQIPIRHKPSIPVLDVNVNCYFQLSEISQFFHLRELIPSLQNVSSALIVNQLRSTNLLWDMGLIKLYEAKRLEKKAEKIGIKVVIKS